VEWTSLKFSNDGKYILISTNVNIIYVIDAYEGTILQTIEGFENKVQLNLAAGFTPDVKYIYSGMTTNSFFVFLIFVFFFFFFFFLFLNFMIKC